MQHFVLNEAMSNENVIRAVSRYLKVYNFAFPSSQTLNIRLQHLDERKTKAKELTTDFDLLCSNVDNFRDKWQRFVRKTGSELDESIARIEKEIDKLRQKLKQYALIASFASHRLTLFLFNARYNGSVSLTGLETVLIR